jgi:glycosyltransferase involved in cell wall biosynthesis
VNYETALRAADLGHELYLVAAHVAPELLERENVHWVPISYGIIPTSLIRYQVFAFRSWLWLRANRSRLDVIHVNGAITWARGDLNSVHFVHNGWRRSSAFSNSPGLRGAYQALDTWVNSIAERRSFADATHIVTVSPNLAREIAELKIEPERIDVVQNGIDAAEFAPGPGDRPRFGLPPGGVVALFTGDLRTERKNLDTVLSAVAGVPKLHLAVAGAFEGSRFPALARRLGIGDRVHFVGMIKEMPLLLRSVDFCVFPSRYEPWGMVVPEAMAAGLPVITSRSTGASEIVTGGAGFVIDDPDDVHALAQAIRTVASDAAMRSAAGAKARAIVQPMSWAKMADQYVALYTKLSAERQTRIGSHH